MKHNIYLIVLLYATFLNFAWSQNDRSISKTGHDKEANIFISDDLINQAMNFANSDMEREVIKEILEEKRFKKRRLTTELRSQITSGDGAEPFYWS